MFSLHSKAEWSGGAQRDEEMPPAFTFLGKIAVCQLQLALTSFCFVRLQRQQQLLAFLKKKPFVWFWITPVY